MTMYGLIVLIYVAATSSGDGSKPVREVRNPSTVTSERDSGSKEAQAPSPIDVAKEWLHALKATDTTSLSRITGFPFVFRSMGRKIGCDGILKTPSDVAQFGKCFRTKEKLFLEELGYGEAEMKFQLVDVAAIPKVLRAQLDGVTAAQRIVTTYVNGDGVTYTMFFIVLQGPGSGNLVSRFLLKASFSE
jgi:hypothetical protein